MAPFPWRANLNSGGVEVLIRERCQMACPMLHHLRLLSFNHDAKHRLGPAGPHQDSSSIPHVDLSGTNGLRQGGTVSPTLATGSIRNGHID